MKKVIGNPLAWAFLFGMVFVGTALFVPFDPGTFLALVCQLVIIASLLHQSVNEVTYRVFDTAPVVMFFFAGLNVISIVAHALQ